MPSRLQSAASFGIPSTAAAATVVIAALLSPGSGSPPPVPVVGPGPLATPVEPAGAGHAIDVVFAVDTTGSMGRLIEGAKRTVWSIATHIREADPNANLRIGLVAYRDTGEDYVTRPFALTGDLDAVYTELSAYTAAGGGDAPEDVAAGLRDALAMRWRAGAKKIVFVVGDAPPIARGDAPPYEDLAREAAATGVIVNAIRCGGDVETALAFQRIATLAGGDFSTIAADGGVHQVATPYDARIGALSDSIDGTAVIAGDDGVRRAHAGKLAAAAAAPAAAKADRAKYYLKKARGGADVRAEGDLVGAYATGTLDLGKVAPGALPADLRDKDTAEITAELGRRAAQREAAQKEMADLERKRDEYLAGHKGGEGGGAGGFDTAVKATVEKQIK